MLVWMVEFFPALLGSHQEEFALLHIPRLMEWGKLYSWEALLFVYWRPASKFWIFHFSTSYLFTAYFSFLGYILAESKRMGTGTLRYRCRFSSLPADEPWGLFAFLGESTRGSRIASYWTCLLEGWYGMASLSVQRWHDNGLVLPFLSILEYLTGYWFT